jgi:hypothetical protein
MARQLSTALKNYLSTWDAPSPSGIRAFSMADLYEISSPVLDAPGTATRFTSWPSAVTYGGNVFASGVVIPTRGKVRQQLGLEVDQLDMQVGHGGTAVYGSSSMTWAQAALTGALDGATVRLYRAFFDSSAVLVDAVILFSGYVGEVEPKSTLVRLTVESVVARLKAPFPRMVLGAGCGWNLYDAGCGLTRPTTWDARTSAASSDPKVLKVASLNYSGGLVESGTAVRFKYGTVTITGPTSSPLYGLSRTVISSVDNGANHDVTVSPAFPSAPGAGLTVKLQLGCNKTAAACETYFSNLTHYAGAPVVPPDQTRKG